MTIASAAIASTPIAASRAAAETHALAAVSIETGTPILDTPTLGQMHALAAVSIATGTPTLDMPTLSSVAGTDNLAATSIATGTPTLDMPTLGQVHALAAVNIATGMPILDASTLSQVHALAAVSIVTGAPILDAPTINDVAFVLPDLTTPGGQIAVEVRTGMLDAGLELGEGAALYGTLTRPAPLADTPWGTPAGSDRSWSVVLLSVTPEDMWKGSDTLIKGDTIVMMDAASSPRPVVGDTMVLSTDIGTTHKIVDVQPLEPAGVPLLYMLGLVI